MTSIRQPPFGAQLSARARSFLQSRGIELGAEPSLTAERDASRLQRGDASPGAGADASLPPGGDASPRAARNASRRALSDSERAARERLPSLRTGGDAPDPTRGERRARNKLERMQRARARAAAADPKARRNRDRLARRRRRDAAYLDRLRGRLKAAGVQVPAWMGVRAIPRSAWIMCRDILSDASGKAARIWLRRHPNKVTVGAIRAAALVPFADGSCRYTWADFRARAICALGLLIAGLAIPTLRRGPWNGLVRGVPRGALCAALQCPYSGRRPSIAALAGTHRAGGCLETGQVGYLRALELAGAVYAQQLPAHLAEPWECAGPSGYAINRYWVLDGELGHVSDDDVRAAMLRLAAAGWAALDERPVRSTVRGQPAAVEPLSRAQAPP